MVIFISYALVFLRFRSIHITIPATIINNGTTNIIILTTKSSAAVGVYAVLEYAFLIVIVSVLSVKYEIEFNNKSMLFPK